MTKEEAYLKNAQDRRRIIFRFITLGRVLERFKDAPPGTAIPQGSANLLRDMSHHRDLPNRVSREVWEFLHHIDTGQYYIEPDRRTWLEICMDLEKQGIGRLTNGA